MDVIEILKTIKEDWAILVFFFSMGAAWWQGKAWFKGVNDTLNQVKQTAGHNQEHLMELRQKMDHLHDRVGNLEKMSEQIDRELQQQEVKLAVLENTVPIRRAASR